MFVAQGVVGARSGSFGSCCDRGPNRRVQLSPDHSLDPAKKGEKEGVGGGSICQGGKYQVHLVEGNPRKGVPASAISGVSARGPPRPLACISTRLAFAARCKYLERKEGKGVKIFQGGLTQVLLFGLPREGRNHLHGPWTECRVQGEEKTRPAVLDARPGDKDSERGVKGGPHQGKEDKGSWRGLTNAQASSSVVRAGARVRRAPPVGVAAPRGAVTDSESPVNLRSR